MKSFEHWWSYDFYNQNGDYTSAEAAWYEQQERFEEFVERVETECSYGAYSTTKECLAAKNMKESILQILKGEK